MSHKHDTILNGDPEHSQTTVPMEGLDSVPLKNPKEDCWRPIHRVGRGRGWAGHEQVSEVRTFVGHSWTGGAAETQDRARKVGLALQIQGAEPKAAATAGRHSRRAEERESQFAEPCSAPERRKLVGGQRSQVTKSGSSPGIPSPYCHWRPQDLSGGNSRCQRDRPQDYALQKRAQVTPSWVWC